MEALFCDPRGDDDNPFVDKVSGMSLATSGSTRAVQLPAARVEPLTIALHAQMEDGNGCLLNFGQLPQ